MSFAWRRCVTTLEKQLDALEFERWIAPLTAKQTDSSISIFAPDESFADRLMGQPYWETITQLLQSNSQESLRIELEARPSDSNDMTHIQAKASGARVEQQLEKSGLRPQFSFSNFVTGQTNAMVCAAAKEIAQHAKASIYNPFFIYGRSGQGKTHLLFAIGNHLVRHTNVKVFYQHAPRFVTSFVAALNQKKMPEFKRFYSSFDVLLIDDVHLFADKTGTQEELFQIINLMLEGHKQVVFTCDRYPKDLSGFTDRLRSRFGAGLALEVKPPELELRVAILKSKAEEIGLSLPEDVAFLVAKKIRSNVRELQSALATLKAYHEFKSNQPVSLISAGHALENAFASHSRTVTIDQIIKAVAGYYYLRNSDLTSCIRRQPIVRARHLAMMLAKDLTNLSLAEIGEAFKRDHSTVLHAYRNMSKLRSKHPNIESDYHNLYTTLSS